MDESPGRYVPGWLADRRRRQGADPLLTYYDLDSGERTELSATTYGNWVDKTANLLLDAGVDAGDTVALPLAATHPGHWVTLVWWAAVWQLGAVAELADTAAAVLRVVGPDQAYDLPDEVETVACSLHPLGLGFTAPLPAGVIDYGVEVRGFPDTFLGVPPRPAAGVPVGLGDPDARVLIRPGEAWEVLRSALARPLAGRGSSVLVVGAADSERIAALARTERTNL